MKKQEKHLAKKVQESMGVESITSSFMAETRQGGLKSSSFVSYTVKCKYEEGWSLEEARLAEAILAERVSKDLYADLGSRDVVDMRQIITQQKKISSNYQRLQEKIVERMISPEEEVEG